MLQFFIVTAKGIVRASASLCYSIPFSRSISIPMEHKQHSSKKPLLVVGTIDVVLLLASARRVREIPRRRARDAPEVCRPQGTAPTSLSMAHHRIPNRQLAHMLQFLTSFRYRPMR
jgi:hypothetical protein